MSALLFVALISLATASSEAHLTTLDGREVAGKITAWDAGAITINAAEGPVELPAESLLDIRFPREKSEAPEAMYVELIDGTRLACSEFSVAGRTAAVKIPHLDKPLNLQRDAIRRVELRPSTPLIEGALDEIEQKDVPEDALVISQRGSESMDYLTGVIGDVTAEQAQFQWDGEQVPVKRAKIAAMVFYQAPAALRDVVCQLRLTDGSHIALSEASLTGETLKVTTPSGVQLEIPLDHIVRADFSSGKIAYLSDLKPAEVHWTPGLSVPASEAISTRNLPKSDASFSGQPLSLLWTNEIADSNRDVRTYSKGLAIRSGTEITYRLPDGMTRFIAIAGLDPQGVAKGNVILTVRGDDRVLWEGVIDGGQPPMEIDVELTAARRLHLNVDYGDRLDFGDRLHLVEARVTK